MFSIWAHHTAGYQPSAIFYSVGPTVIVALDRRSWQYSEVACTGPWTCSRGRQVSLPVGCWPAHPACWRLDNNTPLVEVRTQIPFSQWCSVLFPVLLVLNTKKEKNPELLFFIQSTQRADVCSPVFGPSRNPSSGYSHDFTTSLTCYWSPCVSWHDIPLCVTHVWRSKTFFFQQISASLEDIVQVSGGVSVICLSCNCLMAHVYWTLELNPYPSDKLDVLCMYLAAFCFHVWVTML